MTTMTVRPVPTPTTAPEPATGRARRRLGEGWVALAFLLPAIAVISTFVIYPLVTTGYWSLTSWDGLSPVKRWVGLDNYQRLLNDPAFRNSLVVTVLYGVGVSVLGVATGLAAALLLHAPLRGRGWYRTAFFVPVVTSSIAAAGVWTYLFDASGPVNVGLQAIGFGAPNWLGDPHLALVCLTLLTVWKQLGLNTILYLTALQAIPASIYEAADIDGAGRWARLRRLTFPLLAPMTFFVVVQSLVATFQGFDLVYVLTQGGPLSGTEVLGFLMYGTAFSQGEFGYAASMAFAGFALVFGLAWVQWRVGSREDRVA